MMSNLESVDFNAAYFASLIGAIEHSDYWLAKCPCHDDNVSSLSIRQGDTAVLVKCHAGCESQDIIDFYRSKNQWPKSEGGKAPKPPAKKQVKTQRVIDRVYDYVDEHGTIIFQVVRYQPKGFAQRRVLPNGEYEWGLKGIEKLVPYRLQEFFDTKRWSASDATVERPVVIFEGEKDADLAHELGILGTTFSSGAGKWREEYLSWFIDREVYIVPDDDEPGHQHARMIADHLHPVCQGKIKIIELPNPDDRKGFDFSDYIAAGGTKETFASLIGRAEVWHPDLTVQTAVVKDIRTGRATRTRKPFDPENPQDQWTKWMTRMKRKADGSIDPRSLNNAMILLQYHPDMIGRLGWNERSNCAWMIKPFPWDNGKDGDQRPLKDSDEIKAAQWLERHGVRKDGAGVIKLLETIADEYPFDRLAEYLVSLEWDGKPRVRRFLSHYFGAEDSPVNSIIGVRFMVAAVARAIRPGCKMENMLVLEGAQGTRKSDGLRTLFGDEYFCDSMPMLTNGADAAMQLMGHWCVEIQEMNSLEKTSYNRVKEFLSVREDKYRPPYGRRPISVKRGSVLVGTLNPEGGYLKDPTGGRRFWPVSVGQVRLSELADDRDQLWAEAYQMFEGRTKWWFDQDDEEAATLGELQMDRYSFDIWSDDIAAYCYGKERVKVKDICMEALGYDLNRIDKSVELRVTRTLTALGLQRGKSGSSRYWYLHK